MKCFGGPYHGREIELPVGRYRFEVAGPYLPEIAFRREPATYFPEQITTYYVHRFGRWGAWPTRRKEIAVAIVEGAELTKREEVAIERELAEQPWEIANASILHDFDQWFAESVYRNMGILWWTDGPAYAD